MRERPSKEEIDRIVKKWSVLLDYKEPLSGSNYAKTAMLIPSQERWHTPEEIRQATPNKNDNQ